MNCPCTQFQPQQSKGGDKQKCDHPVESVECGKYADEGYICVCKKCGEEIDRSNTPKPSEQQEAGGEDLNQQNEPYARCTNCGLEYAKHKTISGLIGRYCPTKAGTYFIPQKTQPEQEAENEISIRWPCIHYNDGEIAEIITHHMLPLINQFKKELTTLRTQNAELAAQCSLLEMRVLLWSSTFQKYQSWKANKVPAKDWPEQVLKDYEKLDALKHSTATPSARDEYVKGLEDALLDLKQHFESEEIDYLECKCGSIDSEFGCPRCSCITQQMNIISKALSQKPK